MKLDIEKLKIALPGIAKKLADMMVNDALPVFQENGISFDDALPSVGITFETPEGSNIKVSLSIENPESDDEPEDDED